MEEAIAAKTVEAAAEQRAKGIKMRARILEILVTASTLGPVVLRTLPAAATAPPSNGDHPVVSGEATEPAATPPVRPRSAACGWTAVSDAVHPEWPPRLVRTAEPSPCAGQAAKTLAVKAAANLTMILTTDTASASIRVTALESGSLGETIRCRSSIDGAIVRGRIASPGLVEMLPREQGHAW